MGRIRILSDNVANKIAAGEVVERPASVVKELLENSLDAGATDFRLDIEAGGRKLIRLADDGSGMMQDDALLAFERHATSKLSDVKDLLSISTLGFRGEALPSIASVSRLLLETKAREERVGTVVEISGGKMFRVEELAHPGGTTITVRDLFQRPGAQEISSVGSDGDCAHCIAGDALQPGASLKKLFSAPQQSGTAERHSGRHAARAGISGVRLAGFRRSI
jgi:DNA mismatch repair protein MutL